MSFYVEKSALYTYIKDNTADFGYKHSKSQLYCHFMLKITSSGLTSGNGYQTLLYGW